MNPYSFSARVISETSVCLTEKAAIAILSLSSFIASTATNDGHMLIAFAIVGGIVGGLVGVVVFSDQIGQKERGLRWAVNVSCSIFAGVPFTRLICKWMGVEVDPEMTALGGGLIAIFGVSMLVMLKALLPGLLKFWLKVKGINLDQNEKK